MEDNGLKLSQPSEQRLGEREESLAGELGVFGSELEGLYREAHRLLERAEEPGVAYLICHAGRELSRGLLRQLSDGKVDSDLVSDTPNQERYRASIAAALGFRPNDLIVTEWYRMHVFFADNVHYQTSPAPPSEISSAFHRFWRLLFMVLAPYFNAKPELDRLLRLAGPTPEDLASLRVVLARRALRVRFLSEAKNPEWLQTLSKMGMFSNPPTMRHLENDGSEFPAWDGGRYLIRSAAAMPDVVVEIFEEISRDNVNASVWWVVIEAALVLPESYLPRIARLISRALHKSATAVFGRDLVRLAERLAASRLPEAFKFVNTILLFEKRDSPRFGRHWLRYLDEYHFGQVVERVLPLLGDADGRKTFELLINKLKVASERAGDAQATQPGWSRAWCRHIGTTDRHEETPGVLAAACFRYARRIAVDSTQARYVCEQLTAAFKHHETSQEIFQRIVIRLLADIGRLVPDFVDALLVSDAAIDPPFGPSEVAQALRHAFSFGSAPARNLFRYALERGPGLDEIAWEWRHGEVGDARSAVEIAATVADWQRRRMMWFQDDLPDELIPLAEQIGFEPRKLSPREQALNEYGVWVGSGPSPLEMDVSPISLEELQTMSDEAVLDILVTWEPPGGPFEPGLPSKRELRRTFVKFLTNAPHRLNGIIARLPLANLEPAYLQAACDGIASVATSGHVVSWDVVLDVIDHALGRAVAAPPGEEAWAFAATRGIELLETAAHSNLLPLKVAERAVATFDTAIAARDHLDRGDRISDLEELVSDIYGQFSAGAVRGLIELMLALIRHQRLTDPTKTPLVTAPPLSALLLDVLTHGAMPARGALGRHLPWVVRFVPEINEPLVTGLLAEDDLTDPMKSPVWGMYIVRSQHSSRVFALLRPVFLNTAVKLSAARKSDGPTSNRWSFSEYFTQHVTVALLTGDIAVADDDALLQITYDSVPTRDRSHGYWLVWRHLEDAHAEIDDAACQRVLAFWQSRLDSLESAPDNAERALSMTLRHRGRIN